jgi:hypothetical protein
LAEGPDLGRGSKGHSGDPTGSSSKTQDSYLKAFSTVVPDADYLMPVESGEKRSVQQRLACQ